MDAKVMASATNLHGRENFRKSLNVPPNGYKHDIQFYGTNVEGIIDLDDLKKLGATRLQILKIVHAITDTCEGTTPNERLRNLVSELGDPEFKSFVDLFDGGIRDSDEEERRRVRWMDHVSYMAVNLALGEEQETKWWFQKAEERLFEWRLAILNDQEILEFMEINGMRYRTADEDEKARLKDQLIGATKTPEKFSETIFHKVPFLEAVALLRNHKIHVKSGVAYLTTSQLRSVICHRYRRHLDMWLESSEAKHLYIDDPRFFDVINHLRRAHTSMKSNCWNTEPPLPKDLDNIAVESYPPCMRKLHEALRRDHHLRNQGRVQYTLFLKKIGLPAESAIEFFSDEFTRIMDENKFQKEYAYYIKHLYGLVGSKGNYEIYDCSKIAEFKVGKNEYHGCPFALGDIEDLDDMLTRWNISSAPKAEIVGLTMNKRCSRACAGYFEATHGCSINREITNPIVYYGESKKNARSKCTIS